MAHILNSQNPIVTISLLSSGRDNTVRKCLESVERLRTRVPSELIIVDTGAPEDIKRIHEEYTDIIVPFTWCNDFSAARNAGLAKAKGKWFLFIDDDEWFEDTSEIEIFFLNGEYKHYGMANYIVRNYLDREGISYHDTIVTRAFAIHPDTRFVGPIHEEHYPIRGNEFEFTTFAHHYGYCFDTEEDRKRHTERNLNLLKDVISKDPDNIRWYAQIIAEYRMLNDFSKVGEYCKAGLYRFKNKNDREINLHRGSLYNGYIMSLLMENNEQEAISRIKEALSDKRNTKLCNAALLLRGAEVAFNTRKYDLCSSFCKDYLKTYKELINNKSDILNGGYFFVDDAVKSDNVERIHRFTIHLAAINKDKAFIKEYSDRILLERITSTIDKAIPCNSEKSLSSEAEIIRIIIGNPASTQDEALLSDIIDLIILTEPCDEAAIITDRLLNNIQLHSCIIKQLRSKEIQDHSSIIKLAQVFGKEYIDSDYFLYLHTIFCLQDNNESLETLTQKLPFERWTALVDYIFTVNNEYVIDTAKSFIEGMTSELSNEMAYLYIGLIERSIVKGCENSIYTDLNSLENDIEGYSSLCVEYYSMFFKEPSFAGKMEFLPLQARAAVHLNRLLYLRRNGASQAVLDEIKESISNYPALSKVYGAYLGFISEMI